MSYQTQLILCCIPDSPQQKEEGGAEAPRRCLRHWKMELLVNIVYAGETLFLRITNPNTPRIHHPRKLGKYWKPDLKTGG